MTDNSTNLTEPLLEDSAMDRDARLVAEMRAAIRRRDRAERDIEVEASEGDDAETFAAADALSERIEALETEIADRERDFATARQAFQDRFQAETDDAESEYHRVVSEVTRSCEERREQVEHQYEENQWMLGSLLDDDSENSPKRLYETLRDQLHASRDQLTERSETLREKYDAARAAVERRGLATEPLNETTSNAHSRRDALMLFEQGERLVLGGAERISRQAFARSMNLLVLGLIFAAIAAGVFVIARFGLSPETLGLRQIQPRMWIILCVGAAMAAGLMVVVVLHAIARRQTQDAFTPIEQGIVEARANHARWLSIAKDELQRQEQVYREQQQSLVERRDAAAQKFDSERDAELARIEADRTRGLEEPTRKRNQILQEAQWRSDADQRGIETAHAAAVVDLQERIARERRDFEQTRARHLADREAEHTARIEAMAGDWTSAVSRLESAISETRQADQHQSRDWSAILEEDWTPPTEIPHGLRIGDYLFDLKRMDKGVPRHESLSSTPRSFSWPARLPFPTNPSLCLKTPHAGRDTATAVLQVAMLRLLTQLPPGKVRFTVLDPVGLGESFSAFMHLADSDELLISSRIWTEPTQIDEQLAKLTDHMESVFQKYLRGEYETIEDYNVEAGEVAEPYRILVVAGFPNGFGDRAAERLASILTSGPRCGVFPLIVCDTTQQMPNRFDVAQLDDAGTLLDWNGSEFVRDRTKGLLALRPDQPPAAGEFTAIVRKIGELSKYVRRVEVPFRRIIPSESDWWAGDSRRGLDCPLGRAGATRLQTFHVGTGTSQHALIAGKTGSGKSTLLHVLITNLALRYSPEDLEFYLIDFKKGVEFKVYATGRLPHARVIAIESDREFAVSVLERLDSLLKERGDRFRDAGVHDIASFRNAHPDVPMPRILLMVDEFQEFFTEDDRHAQSAALLLDRLVRQGRAFGMHVLLGSQTLGGAYSLARTTIGQMAVRIALQCSESDAHLILSEDNTAARLLTRPGEAIYNDANGMLEGNSPFQIAWLSDEEQNAALAGIAQLAVARDMEGSPPIVFEGNIPADPARNRALTERIGAAGNLETADSFSGWIGEAVAITGPSEIVLRGQSGANVLIAGPDEASAVGIITTALIGLAAARPVMESTDETSPMICLLTPKMDQARLDRWGGLADVLGDRLRLGGVGEASEIATELARDLEQRKSSGQSDPPRLLVIDDFGRFRDLRKSDDDFGFGGFDREKEPSVSQRFAEILRDGPAHGIHTILWCDTYNNIDRGLGRQLTREFELRIAFQMSGADSSNLIDTPRRQSSSPHTSSHLACWLNIESTMWMNAS